jgi:hypothetical protein
VAVSRDLGRVLDQAYEDKSPDEILAAWPVGTGGLQGAA